MSSRIFFKPKVSLIGTTQFHAPGHIFWRSDDQNPNHEIVEFGGRLCYMSFGDTIVDGHKAVEGRTSNKAYIDNILKVKHGSVIEHANYSLLFEGVSRSLTHELVRHRHFSYSQLSQRYVDESEVAYVVPPELINENGTVVDEILYGVWLQSTRIATSYYQDLSKLLIEKIVKAEGAEVAVKNKTALKKRVRQTARSVLPNCTETKIVVTGNTRAWRFFLQQRGSAMADTEIRRLALICASILKDTAPNLFADIQEVTNEEGLRILQIGYPNV